MKDKASNLLLYFFMSSMVAFLHLRSPALMDLFYRTLTVVPSSGRNTSAVHALVTFANVNVKPKVP